MSSVAIAPYGTSSTSTSRAHAFAIDANRAENAPFTIDSTRPDGAQRTADSISPVAEELLTYTGRVVPKIGLSALWIVAYNDSNAAPRCAMSGRVIAARTSSRTSVGPG